MAPFVGKYVSSCEGNSIVCSLTIYEIFAMKVKVKKEKNRSCAVRLEMFDFIQMIYFRILTTQQHTFTQMDTQSERQGMTIGKIC